MMMGGRDIRARKDGSTMLTFYLQFGPLSKEAFFFLITSPLPSENEKETFLSFFLLF